jgi:protein SCO1/2
MFSHQRWFAVLAVGALLAIGVGTYLLLLGDDSGGSKVDLTALANAPFLGRIVDPPYDKPDVVLTDTTGKPFDFRKETEGYVTLFYVGYTHCPDICPTHMHDLAHALKGSDPAVAAKVKVVFVTADPERDTPQVLGDWIHFFSPEFIGLVPTKEQLSALLTELHMPQTVYTDLGGGNYSCSHAAYVIAFTTDNQGHLAYREGFTIEDWHQDLHKLALIGWKTS